MRDSVRQLGADVQCPVCLSLSPCMLVCSCLKSVLAGLIPAGLIAAPGWLALSLSSSAQTLLTCAQTEVCSIGSAHVWPILHPLRLQLTREDSYLDFRRPAAAVHNMVRALAGWPGARATLLVEEHRGGE